MTDSNELLIPEERIMNKIYIIRNLKVMLDMDLAELYGLETKYLKRAVRRNISRFPPDFMFELTDNELSEWRCNFGTSNREKMGLRIPPFAFTEHGVLMLASVLNSERAIQVNIRIVRIFLKMREMLIAHQDLEDKLSIMQRELSDHDEKIMRIFEYLQQMEQNRQQEELNARRKRIGYKREDEKTED